MLNSNWLNSLKVGDKVVIDGNMVVTSYLDTITKITKTIIFVGHTKFRKTNGTQITISNAPKYILETV